MRVVRVALAALRLPSVAGSFGTTGGCPLCGRYHHNAVF